VLQQSLVLRRGRQRDRRRLHRRYARTGESYTDHSQLTSITVGGKTYAGQNGSTDQSERIRLVLQSDFAILWRTRLGTGTATA
jgi:hypothetical protein